MEIQRTAYQSLLKWKSDPNRKVLLIRGARQVGKTYLIRKLGKTFKHYSSVTNRSRSRCIPAFTDRPSGQRPALQYDFCGDALPAVRPFVPVRRQAGRAA